MSWQTTKNYNFYELFLLITTVFFLNCSYAGDSPKMERRMFLDGPGSGPDLVETDGARRVDPKKIYEGETQWGGVERCLIESNNMIFKALDAQTKTAPIVKKADEDVLDSITELPSKYQKASFQLTVIRGRGSAKQKWRFDVYSSASESLSQADFERKMVCCYCKGVFTNPVLQVDCESGHKLCYKCLEQIDEAHQKKEPALNEEPTSDDEKDGVASSDSGLEIVVADEPSLVSFSGTVKSTSQQVNVYTIKSKQLECPFCKDDYGAVSHITNGFTDKAHSREMSKDGALAVGCPFCDSFYCHPAQLTVNTGFVDKHMEICEGYPIACCYQMDGCEFTTPRRSKQCLPDHQQACRYRSAECEHCKQNMKYLELKDHHELSCQEFPVKITMTGNIEVPRKFAVKFSKDSATVSEASAGNLISFMLMSYQQLEKMFLEKEKNVNKLEGQLVALQHTSQEQARDLKKVTARLDEHSVEVPRVIASIHIKSRVFDLQLCEISSRHHRYQEKSEFGKPDGYLSGMLLSPYCKAWEEEERQDAMVLSQNRYSQQPRKVIMFRFGVEKYHGVYDCTSSSCSRLQLSLCPLNEYSHQPKSLGDVDLSKMNVDKFDADKHPASLNFPEMAIKGFINDKGKVKIKLQIL